MREIGREAEDGGKDGEREREEGGRKEERKEDRYLYSLER